MLEAMRLRPWLMLILSLSAHGAPLPKDDGYRGIWYFNQPSKDEFKYKYSGGFATYPQQHAPIAIYSKEANKTFFCYGGTVKGRQELLHMVSYYDHATGMVPRPTILLNKKTDDAHDNPTISIDAAGHIWIFSSAHGASRPSYIHRSRKPLFVDEFELIQTTNFSYPQSWHFAGRGFLFLHTLYGKGRGLYWKTSGDGVRWSESRKLAFALQGHYQISWPWRGKLGAAFDVHPPPLGLNERTNLYYMESADFGESWKTADGRTVPLPVVEERSPALVRDYHAEKLLVYLKDLNYDSSGRPVIVYLTSKWHESGPKSGPRALTVARWTGKQWRYSKLGETDHNYDHGSLYIEAARWRFIGPTGAGPQPYGTGGEVEEWVSSDDGLTWKRSRALTSGSRFNHTYVRRPLNAHPDFYAFWADGDAFKESESRLYFANRKGEVFRLPAVMKADYERPERVRAKKE